ncbi:hypothetical protein KL942_001581 [Ogataea angusta]|uniref:Cytochrome b-c1 complex subunit 7 n=1 Tax=Pichia angusta TaxID=870730 RepID=A0ABQ7S032_PICAN|nr:hypothetical protein KL909_001297 [Ogataea angusta]KAG7830192.1 hypothetical protein KL920_001830 [Ogataea angusta]KAG7834676.1 hypothetical protein KL943_003060 [Ogataea angusta]KAG7841702.1 hypothetical protein KL942_001581 [Ogataea angusta]KAG7850720.1 hypothetical protein KL940_001297 [Ogataea angusta]
MASVTSIKKAADYVLKTPMLRQHRSLLTFRLDDLMIEETPLMQKVISRLPADESYARNYRIITAHQLVLSAKVLPPSKVLKPEEDIPYMLPYILEAEAEEFEKEELNNIAKA